MKTTLTFLFALFVIGSFPAFSNTVDIHNGDGDIEEIIVETINDTGNERGDCPVIQAFLIHATNTLSISFRSSIGLATIIVTNAAGCVIYTDMINTSTLNFMQFSAPTSSGQYTLHIKSASYDGLGSFSL